LLQPREEVAKKNNENNCCGTVIVMWYISAGISCGIYPLVFPGYAWPHGRK